ncbi:hypothetical protein [Saccharopolyspora sp. 6V]|uniref:hypothetical protein n=1 Tax=Saccharopolyspora sp. 6V TaxID=2877239 RepID=UPI001CD723DB|nr:hypothetical protein [Saccharopolyspora sp. 6V]MCA1195338.1 hypothetical protein [Saccharopolyspora sp. 6V]
MTPEEQFTQDIEKAFARYREHADLEQRLMWQVTDRTGSLIGCLSEISFHSNQRSDV